MIYVIASSLPYAFPAGFGAGTPQQKHFGNSQELEKQSPGWPLLHPQKRTIDFGRWFFFVLLALCGMVWYTRLSSTTRNLSGQSPSILLRKTVLSLKSPTGAFIVLLRSTNANLYIKENIDETVFMFALFKCRKSDKGRN